MLRPKSPHDKIASPDRIEISLCEHRLTPLPEGALWWAAEKTLIVSDLHLEKGASYAMRGQFLPPYDSHATLARASRLIDALKPTCVVSLGDSFHTPNSADHLDEASCQAIRELTARVDWVWVEGNHDPDPPQHLGGRAAKELRLGRLTLRHEPTGALGEVAGHMHPCAKLVGRAGKALRRRCFVTNGQSLILPAMGAFTGGFNILDQAYDPLLGPARQAIMLGQDRAFAVPQEQLIPDGARGAVWRLNTN